MSTQMQLRGGTTAENLLFTGAQREVTVDTDRNALVVHDGVTAGGYPTASEEDLVNGTFYYNDNTGGGSAANAYILTPKSNTNTPTQYLDGVQFGFVTANQNATGGSTANFSGLGVKNIKYPGGIDPAAGDIFGRVDLVYDAASDWLELQRKGTAASPQIRTITGSVLGNGLTASAQAATVNFRSASLPNGAVTSLTFTSPISITAPAGATLGTTNAAPSRIVVLFVNNAGVTELALTNINNSALSFDESSLISTSAINAGSTSANVVYSATPLAGVAYRVAGIIESTQAIAGTWSTTPSKVQGQGGQAIIGQNKGLTAATLQPTTAGTSIDFTGIPIACRRITMLLNGVSTNGTSPLLVQIGPSAAPETTGYLGGYVTTRSGASTLTAVSTVGLALNLDPDTAAILRIGVVTATRLDGSTWILSGSIMKTDTGGTNTSCASKTVTGNLERIRLTTTNGTDTFDAGSVNIIYEV